MTAGRQSEQTTGICQIQNQLTYLRYLIHPNVKSLSGIHATKFVNVKDVSDYSFDLFGNRVMKVSTMEVV